MKNAIVGPAQSGKSTVFDLLTAGTIAPAVGQNRIGQIKVPDQRLQQLSALFSPKKTTPAEIVFVDFGRKGKSNKPFSLTAEDFNLLKSCPTISLVIDCFNQNRQQALKSLSSIIEEFILEDLLIVDGRLEAMAREGNKGNEQKLLSEAKALLENNCLLRENDQLSNNELLKHYGFLTAKPLVALLNCREEDLKEITKEDLASHFKQYNILLIPLCAPLEIEIDQLPNSEQQDFLKEVGLKQPMRQRFIQGIYQLLNFISFYTVGLDEVRAWKIKEATNAKKAAGKIHSDLERGFIRAEVIAYNDMLQFKTEVAVKSAGKMRVEGKEYLVQDGDILTIRFNV